MADPRFFDNHGPFSLQELLRIGGCHLINQNADHSKLIYNVSPLETASDRDISFFSNKKYLESFKNSKAGFCITDEQSAVNSPNHMTLLLSENPYYSYALIASHFYHETPTQIAKNPVSKFASFGANVVLGHGVVIEDNVEIGESSYIGHNSVIKRGVQIGKNCIIGANVTISHSIIGNYVTILDGVTIGQDGFGFATMFPNHIKVPQLGRVIIHNHVEIGANTAIDRGAGPDTIIGEMTKIDNMVQIGHNVVTGRGCIIVAGTGIAGSTKLEDFVVLGGQVGIAGHLTIGSGAKIAAQSGVISDIAPKQTFGGYPAVPIRQWHKQSIALRKLTEK